MPQANPSEPVQSAPLLYIVFSSTSSGIGQFIRRVTRHTYNHVSLSLDKNLSVMYSFARYYRNAPLMGGFVEESAFRYLCDKPEEMLVKICAVPVCPEEYRLLVTYLSDIRQHAQHYIYNTFSAAMVPLHRRVYIPDSYTCVEFVNSVLRHCGIALSAEDTAFDALSALEERLSPYTVFEGDLREIVTDSYASDDSTYFPIGRLRIMTGTMWHFSRLIYRFIRVQCRNGLSVVRSIRR